MSKFFSNKSKMTDVEKWASLYLLKILLNKPIRYFLVWLFVTSGMRLILIIFFSILLLFSCKKEVDTPGDGSNVGDDACIQPQSFSSDSIAGEYIIGLNEMVTPGNTRNRMAGDIAAQVLSKNSISKDLLIRSFEGGAGGFVARLTPAQLAALKKDKSIKHIEQDRLITLGNCFTVVASWLVSWNINKVGFGDGTGKVAWVIDSGIDFDHPDLIVDKTLSKSFVDGVTSATDENGHGTHVAGIIAAKNNDFGVLGVASGATLVSLRVMDKNGDGRLSSIIQALAYVNAHAKAGDVVNISISEDGVSEILDEQIKATAAKGIFITLAAGNDGKPANQYSPARVNAPNVYTISAVDSTGTFASFSNYGNDVIDYAAPGVKILSTYKDQKYAIMSGTSMAAPHVAGLLLLNGKNITISGAAIDDPGATPAGIAHN